jgi:general secretion pathway protein D
MALSRVIFLSALLGCFAFAAAAQEPVSLERSDSIHVRFAEVDIRAAVQTLARYLDRPVIFGAVPPARVSLETPTPVPRERVLSLLKGLLESHGLELLEEGEHYRVQARAMDSPGARRGSRGEVGSTSSPELFVIRLRHARASDVAATINALYGRAGAVGEIGARPATLRDELRQQQLPPLGSAHPQQVSAGRAAQLEGEVTIVPDQGTNSLLVRASRQDFELIEAAVEQVDVRPLQVLIEVLIAEVRRDRSVAFGVDAALGPTGVGNVTAEGGTTGLGLGDFALRVMGLGGLDLDATLRAAAARGDVRIISRPIVLAANNEEASILVGAQRPFVQVSRSLPTDTPQRDQVVQYRDVGTQLHVRPTISQEGYVMLQVTQEVNAATTEVQFDAPVISTRSVQTQLLVRDGQTVVLGGLTDRQRDVNQSGVPILSGIPLIGGLFGRASRRTSETELFIFLTPRVVRDDADADALTVPLQQRLDRRR